MREILFRGKRVDNGEWVEGYYAPRISSVVDAISQTREVQPNIRDFNGADWLVVLETVGQYTGLTDKNGIKIFEGDIVEQGNGKLRQVVEWGKWDYNDEFDNVMIATFMCKDKDGNSFYISKHDIVIGNIYENPELLKGE